MRTILDTIKLIEISYDSYSLGYITSLIHNFKLNKQGDAASLAAISS